MKKDTLSPSLIRQLFAIGLIATLGYLIMMETLPYFSGVLGAITVYILFKKLMLRLLDKGLKPWLAATIIIVISIVIILFPIAAIVLLLYSKVGEAIKNFEQLTNVVKDKITAIEDYVGMKILSETNTENITSWVTENIQVFLGSTFNTFIALTVMYFLIYFMLVNVKNLRKIFYSYIPLSDDNITIISKESTEIVKSNAIGIPLVALMQGVVALIGYYIFGVPNPLFWFVITSIGSMIPFIGTALSIVPIAIILMSQGQNWQAVGILIYGATVVASTDNIFRVVIQNRLVNLHPLITLIGVIIGVPMFGFIGLIFGPLLLSLFLLMVKIYKNEYGKQVRAKKKL